MKFRLFLSFFLIALVSTTAFASSRALLSDQVTLTANTFSTGTVDLLISKSTSTTPNSGSFTDITLAGFTDKLLPGQNTSELFWLKNNSSDVDMAIAAQTPGVSGGLNPADITITFTPVANDGTANGGTPVSHTLADWNSAGGLGSTIVHNAGKQRYKMDVALSSSVTTAGSVTFDLVFTGTQTP